MYIQGRSRNHSCRGKDISIMYSEFVFVALGIDYGNRMGQIVICGLSTSEIVSHIISETACFSVGGGAGELLNKKWVVFLIFSTTFVWNIFHSKKNSPRYYHKCA